MDGRITELSPQLAAANRRLYALRAQVQAADQPDSLPDCPVQPTKGGFTQAAAAILPILGESVVSLPAHLGWGSAPLTAALRRWRPQFVSQTAPAWESTCGAVKPETAAAAPIPAGHTPPAVEAVKLYPDMGLAMLRQGQEAAGRLWLMSRFLDGEGRGVLRIDNITQSLTTKSSIHYLCGKRQLRNLLRAGEGVYWTRDKERIWLRSAARVAAALGVERLTGQPVALPLSALLSGIGAFRAHLYAAFHSGRAKNEARRSAMPIARDTLAGLSGVGRTSQRTYEARVGIQTLANFAIGEAATEGGQEERAWRQGQALFTLQDYDGRQGRQGKTYLAWQLPNSYTGQHTLRPKGRQKRINRQLQDLVMKGMPGNEGGLVGRPAAGQPVTARRRLAVATKRYYPNGRAAGQRRPKSGVEPAGPCYWRRQGVGNGRFALWHSLEKA